jgi:hypothetical protein
MALSAPGWGSYVNANGRAISPLVTDDKGNLTHLSGTQGYQSDLKRADTSYATMGAAQAAAGIAHAPSAAGLVAANQVSPYTVNGARINTAGFGAQMAQQGALAAQGGQAISGLQQAARGAVPSAAELQGRIQLQQAQANLASMAASARGGADSRAAAQRQAMQTGGDLNGQIIAQQAAQRAAEQAQARGQLVGAIGQQQQLAQGAAGMQADLATQQAGFNQQATLANQDATMQAQQTNLGAGLQANALDVANQQSAVGAFGQVQGMAMNDLGYNNQLNQLDFERQQAVNSQAMQQYGIDRNVAIQQYQADSQLAAAKEQGKYQMIGTGLNVLGSVGAAALNYAAPNRPRM